MQDVLPSADDLQQRFVTSSDTLAAARQLGRAITNERGTVPQDFAASAPTPAMAAKQAEMAKEDERVAAWKRMEHRAASMNAAQVEELLRTVSSAPNISQVSSLPAPAHPLPPTTRNTTAPAEPAPPANRRNKASSTAAQVCMNGCVLFGKVFCVLFGKANI